MNEILLISLVRNYPLLYDLASPLYNDQQKKEEAWNEIGALMSTSAYDCKVKWTRLRDNYRKALLIRCNKSNDKLSTRAVKHEKELSFLKEKFTQRKKIKTNDNNVETPRDFPKVSMASQLLESTNQINEMKKEPKKQTAVNKNNEINIFFDGIAETVKKFPKKTQVQIKRQIFNLVNDTEASLLDNDNDTGNMYYTAPSVSVMCDEGVCSSEPCLIPQETQEFIPKIEPPIEFEIDNNTGSGRLISHDYEPDISIKEEII